jgi:hypothetical protein
MRALAAAILVLTFAGEASAQRFTGNTVFMAVQCDIGRFAETAGQVGLDPGMKSDVEFSWQLETSTKVEASFKFSEVVKWLIGGPTVRAARSWKKLDDDRIKGTFNLHEKNTAACQKNVLQVPMGISDCLTENTEVLKRGGEASCERTRSVQGTLSVDGKVIIWVLEAAAGGEYDVKATYKIRIAAPAREGSKGTVAQAKASTPANTYRARSGGDGTP